MTLYQLQLAQIDLAHKMHSDGEINVTSLVSKLGEAQTILKEAVRYLIYEPIKSPEGKIAQMAMSELKMLRISIENLAKNCIVKEMNNDEEELEKSEKIIASEIENERLFKPTHKKKNKKK